MTFVVAVFGSSSFFPHSEVVLKEAIQEAFFGISIRKTKENPRGGSDDCSPFSVPFEGLIQRQTGTSDTTLLDSGNTFAGDDRSITNANVPTA